jgi:hypothetical protein
VVCIDKYDDLADAISGIGSAVTTLMINKNVNVTANATVPSTLTLWFTGQGKLTQTVATTTTINGPVIAEPRQIFAGSGTFAFGNGRATELFPQWWGAVGDDSTNNNTPLTNALAAANTAGLPMYWPDGTYLTTATIPSLHTVRHRGPGIVKRGSDLFYVDVPPDTTNTLYVAASGGSDSNDGLTSSQPFATLQAVADAWAWYARTTRGEWTLKAAAGTFTEGVVLDGIRSPTELTIEGTLSAGAPNTFIDGTGAVNINGINCNAGVRVRVKNIKTQDFTTGSGIVFQNGSIGVIDTCDSANCDVGFNASEFTDMTLIGVCNVDVPASGTGIRYYRQSTGSIGDATNAVTVDGSATLSDGLDIRDNSYVVCNNGLVVNDFANFGIWVRRHSYIELRTCTISNNAIGIKLNEFGIWANAVGTITYTSNTQNHDYNGFAVPFDTARNMVIGKTGPSVQGISSNYDLIVSSLLSTGLQFLCDDATGLISIDFNKDGRISYALSDDTMRFTVNSNEMLRVRTTGVSLSGTTAIWLSGADTPEGAVTAVVGSMYTRTNGGANTTLYVKESGSGNTGWVAK